MKSLLVLIALVIHGANAFAAHSSYAPAGMGGAYGPNYRYDDRRLSCIKNDLTAGLKKALSVADIDVYNVHYSELDELKNLYWNDDKTRNISIVGIVKDYREYIMWCSLKLSDNVVKFTDADCHWTNPNTGKQIASPSVPKEGVDLSIPSCIGRDLPKNVR